MTPTSDSTAFELFTSDTPQAKIDHILTKCTKHKLDACIELMAELQQELLWETIANTYQEKTDISREWSILVQFSRYVYEARCLIVNLLLYTRREDPLPQVHPAVILSREQSGKIKIEFQQDLRDYLPEDSRPPEAIWLGGALQPSR